uniref:Uncharacterized protein n=1 Tax=Arundo donax TaxID=35708 RepID=A0A0A8YKA8_ARUDO
MQTEKLQFS